MQNWWRITQVPNIALVIRIFEVKVKLIFEGDVGVVVPFLLMILNLIYDLIGGAQLESSDL